MMKFYPLLFFFIPFFSFSQTFVGDHERYPLFEECLEVEFEQEETCFTSTLKAKVLGEFKLPEVVANDDFRGELIVLFEVTREGAFRIIYVDAPYEELKEEVNRVFEVLPAIKPAQYNSRPISMQFRMPVKVPLERNSWMSASVEKVEDRKSGSASIDSLEEEYDRIKTHPITDMRAGSDINIPLSHELYSRFDDEVNRVGTNFHTAAKPFLYSEVQRYYDFEEQTQKLLKPTDTWLGRKLWNEHLFRFQGPDYWFTVDFGLDLQVGKDLDSDLDVTYNNTRAAIFQGGLGKNFNFYSVVYESQGRFADYINRYAESIRPGTEGAAIIPARGVAKGLDRKSVV